VPVYPGETSSAAKRFPTRIDSTSLLGASVLVQGTNGKADKGVVGRVKTSGGVPPGQECGDDPESSTDLGRDVACIQMCQVTGSQEHEGQSQREEHATQTSRRAESRDPKDEGEDGPADQEDAERIVELMGVCCVSVAGDDSEARDQDGSVRQPEGTIRSEGGGTKVVADLELPHTGQDLGKASVEDSETSDDLDGAARGHTCTDVEEREDEGSQGKSRETQWTGVDDDGACDDLGGGGARTLVFVGHIVRRGGGNGWL